MNIFFLDRDPQIAAQMHCDKHVVKMILESAQLLSTAHRVVDGTNVVTERYVAGSMPARWRHVKEWIINDERDAVLYKANHVNHPSSVWVRSNIDHYRWVHDLLYYLIGEYRYRYGDKPHACEALQPTLLNSPINIPIVDWEDPPQAMPDDVKDPDVVAAYRKYYTTYKADFAKWTRRNPPSWWTSV